VTDLTDRYNASASVISHSFGTYIVAKCLLGFDYPPVSFDTWILCGAVLNPNFAAFLGSGLIEVALKSVRLGQRGNSRLLAPVSPPMLGAMPRGEEMKCLEW
jgi:hypothetical protein